MLFVTSLLFVGLYFTGRRFSYSLVFSATYFAFYALFSFVSVCAVISGKVKTPPVYTNRLKRLYVFSGLLVILSGVVALCLMHDHRFLLYAVCAPCAAVFATAIANIILNPFERLNNRRYAKKTKRKIKEQMITRRIKSRNVLCAYDNEDDTKNTSRKELYKKFIEEYDQVVNFIRTDDVIREKCKLSNFDLSKVTHTISYEQIIKICIMLNINLSQSDKNSFEDLIHKIFLSQSLNYQTTHSYSFDSQRSTLTGDFYLSILYRSFNSLRKFPLVSYELENKFKSFDSIRSLSISDLKMFRYFNYEKYIKLINQIDKHDFFLFHRAELILKYIIIDILNCKQEFFDMCVRILNKIKPRVIKFMGKIYAIEHICLGVFLFALKIFYGLNDLPYLSLFSALVKNNNFSFNNDLVNKFIDAYDKITKGDKLCDVYRNNRTQIDVINRLNELSEKKEDNEILTVNVQLKKNFTNEFNEKYLKIYYECI